MEWSKAKSLLILLMLAVNLYLGINIYTQVQSRNHQERQMTEDACTLLEVRGFSFEEADLMALPSGLESWTWVRDPKAEQAAAGRLLGTCSEERPGGGIYAYTGESGTVIFRSGGYVEVQSAEGAAPDLAALLAPQGEGTRLTMEERDGQYVLLLDGYTIEGAGISRGEGEAWTGSWIFSAAAQRSEESLSRAKLLLAAAQIMESRGLYTIEEVSCVYALTSLQNGDIRLVPALVLQADGETLCISMITGAELSV